MTDTKKTEQELSEALAIELENKINAWETEVANLKSKVKEATEELDKLKEKNKVKEEKDKNIRAILERIKTKSAKIDKEFEETQKLVEVLPKSSK